MIDKLLGEPYWNEGEEIIRQFAKETGISGYYFINHAAKVSSSQNVKSEAAVKFVCEMINYSANQLEIKLLNLNIKTPWVENNKGFFVTIDEIIQNLPLVITSILARFRLSRNHQSYLTLDIAHVSTEGVIMFDLNSMHGEYYDREPFLKENDFQVLYNKIFDAKKDQIARSMSSLK